MVPSDSIYFPSELEEISSERDTARIKDREVSTDLQKRMIQNICEMTCR